MAEIRCINQFYNNALYIGGEEAWHSVPAQWVLEYYPKRNYKDTHRNKSQNYFFAARYYGCLVDFYYGCLVDFVVLRVDS